MLLWVTQGWYQRSDIKECHFFSRFRVSGAFGFVVAVFLSSEVRYVQVEPILSPSRDIDVVAQF